MEKIRKILQMEGAHYDLARTLAKEGMRLHLDIDGRLELYYKGIKLKTIKKAKEAIIVKYPADILEVVVDYLNWIYDVYIPIEFENSEYSYVDGKFSYRPYDTISGDIVILTNWYNIGTVWVKRCQFHRYCYLDCEIPEIANSILEDENFEELNIDIIKRR